MTTAARGGDGRRPRTQQERVAESTARLLDAAADLLTEQGWAETTAAQIAERAGYSREMVRVRFGSKEGVLTRLMDEWEGLILRDPPTGADGLSSVIDRVVALEEILVERPKFARAVISYTFQSVGGAESRTQLHGWLSELTDATRGLIEAGQADGSVASTVQPAVTARAIADRALGLVLRWLVDDDAAVIEDLAAWREGLIASLSAEPPR